ncbi:MAG: YHS domain-containing protein [Candidatus Krumholzibacteria bacterium]
METPICPTCGCSLVRLGISKDKSVVHSHGGEEHHFCCDGCMDVFGTDPEKYLQESNDLIVCPTCLAEKPKDHAVKLKIAEEEMYFCRCPYCHDVFRKNPGFYLGRLEGTIPNEGVLDHEGCCIRPE